MKRKSPTLLGLLLVACCIGQVQAAAKIEVLDVDLVPLIDQGAARPERFAVNVAHAISASTQGEWSTNGAMRTWTYRVRIPTAVSLSFHSPEIHLPASARLTVGGASATATYGASDVSRGGLWGRPLLGDSLVFSITVPARDAGQVRFEIDSVQAGYRSLTGSVPDHPYYKSRYATANALSAACTQNYSCNETEANRGPAKSTVAVLVGNLFQCTGTLINDVRGDRRTYILTARHCQSGDLVGGAPGVASSVTIYWDAVAPCGGVLSSLYDTVAQAQSGASTVVEQQDAWLLEFDLAPRIPDPYFAGWDATGGVFTGGYSVHHALGGSKQFTAWSGQAILQRVSKAALQSPYDADFWGVVNGVGNVGAGASGGALFDPQNRVVGSASLAYINGAGDGVCPLATLPAPSPSTITAQYTAFSAVFASTTDTSGTTGGTTMQSVLDPDHTGQLVVDGFRVVPFTLTASNTSPRTDGSPITLSWNAPWAQSCTASGGRAGDGWAGSKPISGSAQVMDFTGGSVQYALTCVAPNQAATASATVDWIFIASLISLRGPTTPVMLGGTFDLRWDGNVQPCTASDGPSDGSWAGPKVQNSEQTFTANQLGVTTYTLTCGAGPRTISTQTTVEVLAPTVTLYSDATRIRTGSEFNVWWRSPTTVGRCDGSGGTPEWAPNTVWVQPSGTAIVRSNVPGSITFTMTCSGGGLSGSSSITIEFVDEPPALSLTALSPQLEIIPSGPPLPNRVANLAWTSNMGFCYIASLGPYGMGNKGVDMSGQVPAGVAFATEHIAATYEYVLGCGGSGISARTTIEWVTSNPTVTIRDWENSNGNWIAGYQYVVATTTNSLPCLASGGAPGDGWAGATDFAPNNARSITAPRTPGTYTYTLTCGTGISVGTRSYVVTVGAPAVTLTSTPSSPAAGQWVTLNWNSNASPCSANANGAGQSWGSSNMGYSASSIVTQAVPGTYTYTITCGAGAQAATASTQVTFRSGPATELMANATTATINTPITLTWASGSTTLCQANGGRSGDGWTGDKPVSGSITLTSSVPGLVNYNLNCGPGGATVQVDWTIVESSSPTVPRPEVTLTASNSNRIVGESVTLTWASQNADSCVASGGASGDGWNGSLSLSGSMSVTRASAGTNNYSITCTGATPSGSAQVSVVFSASSGSSSGGGASGGSKSGGGAIDPYLAGVLMLLAMWRLRGTRRN